MTTDRSIRLIVNSSPPDSRRRPGAKLMSYEWLNAAVEPYDGEFPITLTSGDPFHFYLRDVTRSLVAPRLKVIFEPLPGNQAHSPFDAQVTADLRSGVSALNVSPGEEFNTWNYGPYVLANEGVEFEFSVEIDDQGVQRRVWYVDPQMIVEPGG